MKNMRNTKKTVIFLMGPTASGKTALAGELYKHANCELISVDSAQVYLGLDIGSAKPTPSELETYPHHLIDICEPGTPYSASQFCTDANRQIEAILMKNKVPVLVGGTMLYFKALRDGLADLPSADEDVRQQIVLEAEEKGWGKLHAELQSYDQESANRIEVGDTQRLQRAIEVYRLSGKSLTEHFLEQNSQALEHNLLSIAIVPKSRDLMRKRIAERYELMLDLGLVQEVENLLSKGFDKELPALKSVGYRQVIQYLNGELTYEEMKEKAITASRQLAKRQMTWLRKWPNLHWLYSDESQNLQKTMNLMDELR